MNLFEGCAGKTLANELTWLREPREWGFDQAGRLKITPEGETDFFRPCDNPPNDNACLLYREVTGDFTATTRTRAELAGFGDAAAITVRAGEAQWAKLCLERSPIGQVNVVAVVTDPWSDDSNGELLSGPECSLRLTRKGNVFAMHYNVAGSTWRFVRCFAMDMPATVKVGVHAQAPFRDGCKAEFDCLIVTGEPVKDFRSGE